MIYRNIKEEELKLKIASDFFSDFDTTKIFGNIDFCVAVKHDKHNLFKEDVNNWHDSILWAEAKKSKQDIIFSLAQLVLTIGKARTFDYILPPPFLGAFDNEKIAFIHYDTIVDIFYTNDFNWNVTPSNYDTKEFKIIVEKLTKILNNEYLIFNFATDEKELKEFIKSNFRQHNDNPTKIKITKNNFMIIYNKWLKSVKPTIGINWDVAKKNQIIDGDFYLADILSIENKSIKEKLFVLLAYDHYTLDRLKDASGFDNSKTAYFNDNQKAHNLFWNKYERPPREEYWEYIVERRDLLVPQDIRERKGSFFTPEIWVELSQKYLADTLGENWQDEYYIWDCAAGTGNLLNGLTNKYNIFASTLDKQDVDVMKERIKNGANLLESHVFAFDFLNDDFSKLPIELQKIINDEEKRKKLVVYINPPYAEAGTGFGKGHKKDITLIFNINEIFKPIIGNAVNEIFTLFMARIYGEIPNCKIAQFSKLKFVNGSNFIKFKNYFQAKYIKGFIVPADTFDNVKGSFPIGFTIWDTSIKEHIKTPKCDIYDRSGEFLGEKFFYGDLPKGINQWINKYQDKNKLEKIGFLDCSTPDFQNKNYVFIDNLENDKNDHRFHLYFTQNNILVGSIYFAVRHCIEATWLNDRDQFLYPNDKWIADREFQSDCLIFTLFHSQNRISSKEGINHWIPFSEAEVDAKEKFESNFMSDFLGGKLKTETKKDLFADDTEQDTKFIFEGEAKRVLNAGLELWKYYHSKNNMNVNASLYDIKEYFQGRDEKTNKMNSKSSDETYNILMTNLKESLKRLAKKIEPKIYEYGFLYQ